MRKNVLFLCVGLVALTACNKENVFGSPEIASVTDGQEIVIGIGDDVDMDVETKVTAVTTMPSSLTWGATTGTKGTANASTGEKSKWAPASGAVSSNKINTGKYQTATATAYNYYVSNTAFTFTNATASAAGYASIANAQNTTDIICGATYASTSTTPAVTLNHIFARMGTIQMASRSGVTYSNVSYKIKSSGANTGTKGTYNITTGAWSSATSLAEQAIASGSDLYLIPGTYTITVTYTRTVGDNVQTFTKSGNITIVAGKVNNLTITDNTTLPSKIRISLTLTDWDTEDLSLTVS